MDKKLFVENIKKICEARGVKPTVACRESGVDKSFINNIEARGQVPSVEKVQLLAAYLGVTTSELLGEETPAQSPADTPSGLSELEHIYRGLNEEGREKLLGYAKDLEDTGRYIKTSLDRLGKAKDA